MQQRMNIPQQQAPVMSGPNPVMINEMNPNMGPGPQFMYVA